jgi:hypothetical protein
MGRGGGGCAGAREGRWPRHGPELAQQGGAFFFILLITHFIFVSFSFCTKLFSGYSRCWKIKSK